MQQTCVPQVVVRMLPVYLQGAGSTSFDIYLCMYTAVALCAVGHYYCQRGSNNDPAQVWLCKARETPIALLTAVPHWSSGHSFMIGAPFPQCLNVEAVLTN